MAINKINKGLAPTQNVDNDDLFHPTKTATNWAENHCENSAAASTMRPLSKPLQQLQQFATELEKSTPVDFSRVEAIKAAIAAGSYPINTPQLAARLLCFEANLFNVFKDQ